MRQLVPIVICLAIIVGVGGPCAVICLTWDRLPWWRATPKPSRAYRDDKEQVKRWRLRQKHRAAFKEDPCSPAATEAAPSPISGDL